VRFLSDATADGVREREFLVGEVPGVLWAPAGAGGPRPLILMGHGGGQHKKAPGQLVRARHFVTGHGFAVASVDAPGHGGRLEDAEAARLTAAIRQRAEAGEPFADELASANARRAALAVPEWQATLDALRDEEGGPVGYYGVSLGSAIGIPFVAAEPRVGAAVLGLAGHRSLAGPARRVTVPVEFLVQWDDELVPREGALALFDALGSADKTLHANPGRHIEVPGFELDGSARFLARHLGGG
jgi:pimeloyl-ACP methyl ester carboxylesterase